MKFATLLTPEQVKRALGLRGRTNHTLRAFELRGMLHPVRISARTLRYRQDDVERLIAGGSTQAEEVQP